MSESAVDASAVLALLQREPGADVVAEAHRAVAVISSVNLSEVVAKLVDTGIPSDAVHTIVGSLGLEVATFDTAQAIEAGLLRLETRRLGLSLGDRACLALGRARRAPILTTESAWARLGDGYDVRVIR